MNVILFYIVEFFFYSAAGWLIESTYCSIGEGRIINRGFLTGPMCPIYGTAALVMTVFLYNPFRDRPLIVFFLGMLLCNVVEYMTSFLMEKLFHARWWDYTYEFMNINGRVCLKHTLYWAVLSISFINVIHPAVDNLLRRIPENMLVYVAGGVMLIFLLDVFNAVRKALDIRRLQDRMILLVSSVSDSFHSLRYSIGDTYSNIQQSFEESNERINDRRNEFFEQIQDMLTQYELRFSGPKNDKRDKNKYSSRFLRNSFDVEQSIRKQVDKLKKMGEDIKNALFDNNESQ